MTFAGEAVASVADITTAVETADRVVTLGQIVASAIVSCALVDVCNASEIPIIIITMIIIIIIIVVVIIVVVIIIIFIINIVNVA